VTPVPVAPTTTPTAAVDTAVVDPPIAATTDVTDLLVTLPPDTLGEELAEATVPPLELAPTIDTELTSLLLAPTPTDESAPGVQAMPIAPLLDDHIDAAERGPARDDSPAPVVPTATTTPVPTETPRPERTRSAAMAESNAFVPATAPAPPSTAAAATANAAAADAAATSRVAPPPPAEQLVSVLSPLRTTANGSYLLHLELKPAELGRVEMRVEMRDGVLHASIHADREASAHLVRAALNELREQLASEGVRTGTLTVSDGALGSSGREGARHARADADASRSGAASNSTADSADPNLATADANDPLTDSEPTSLLDVRV
jgi:hypothetical protein